LKHSYRFAFFEAPSVFLSFIIQIFFKMKAQQQQDPIFTDAALYAATLKILIVYITYRFKSLSSDLIYDICTDAMISTYYYENLTTSILSFAKGCAKRRAIDQLGRNKVKAKYLSRNYNDCFYLNTEGALDDADSKMVVAINNGMKKLPVDSQRLLCCDIDPETGDLSDDEKAEVLNLNPSGIRVRRCRTKKAIHKMTQFNKMYSIVSYNWGQRA
jgi:DNA-directed RNA polymerase specialized sigma24 family protein